MTIDEVNTSKEKVIDGNSFHIIEVNPFPPSVPIW